MGPSLAAVLGAITAIGILQGIAMPVGPMLSGALASPSAATPPLANRAFLPLVQKSDAPGGVYLGAWVKGFPGDAAALPSFQNTVGRKMAIVMWYEGWNGRDLFNQNAAQAADSQGSLPLVTWEPWDWTVYPPLRFDARIAAGDFDSYLRAYALSVKSYGKPVFIRFAHEMNNASYPWAVGLNGNTAQDYVAAWRHVHDVFAGTGVTNAAWVWSPNVGGTIPLAELGTVYPGDAYVDWLGLDGWNGGTALPWGGWLWFADVFGAYYQKLAQLSPKPIMIAETASVEQGGSKAEWITDAMLTQLPRNFPRIGAFIWFDENWQDASGRPADWRIESSPAAIAAYAQAAASPYFRSSYP